MAFYVAVGFQTKVLTLAWPALHTLSRLHNPALVWDSHFLTLDSSLASLLILMSDWCCFCMISFFLLFLTVPVLGICVGTSDFLTCSCQTSNRDSHCAFQPFVPLFKAFKSLLYVLPTD